MKLIQTRPKHLCAIQWDGQPVELNERFSVTVAGHTPDGTIVGTIAWNEMPIESVVKNHWIVIGNIGPRGYAIFDTETYHANFEECTVIEAETIEIEPLPLA